MTYTTHNLVQGDADWHAHRSGSNNGSELAAAAGEDPLIKRDHLIEALATGKTREFSEWVEENILADGHRCERLCRPLAEAFLDDMLFPATVSMTVDGLARRLSSSLDGQISDCSVNWEHKRLNAQLRAALAAGEIPAKYHWQMEQGLLITRAERCLFSASEWDDNDELVDVFHVWYESNPELRRKIVPVWAQAEADAAKWVPVEVIPAAIAATVQALPVLFVQARGEVTQTNMPEFRAKLTGFIGALNLKPTTDQQFADSKEIAKKLRECSASLKERKADMLAQTMTIGEVAQEIDVLAEMSAKAALALEKAVDAEETNRKNRMIQRGREEVAKYLAELSAARLVVGNLRLTMPDVPADFALAIKGKRNLDSMENAVNTLIATTKITASALANQIATNLKAIHEAGHDFLFSDYAGLCRKAPEDCALVIAARVNKHADDKRKEEEATRERIAKEEREKAEREAASKLEAERRQAAAEIEADSQRQAAESRARIAEAQTAFNAQTDQATVSQNGASSPPEFPAVLSPAEAVAPEPAPSAALSVTGAASVARADAWSLVYDEIDCALTDMNLDELKQVAHFIDRLQSTRKAA